MKKLIFLDMVFLPDKVFSCEPSILRKKIKIIQCIIPTTKYIGKCPVQIEKTIYRIYFSINRDIDIEGNLDRN